jgi:hypothetical protein
VGDYCLTIAGNLNTQPDQQMIPFNNSHSNICANNTVNPAAHFSCQDLHSVNNRCNGLCISLPNLITPDNHWISLCNNLHLCLHSSKLAHPPVQIQLLLNNQEIQVESAIILPNGNLCVATNNFVDSLPALQLVVFDLKSLMVVSSVDCSFESLLSTELIHSTYEKPINTLLNEASPIHFLNNIE